MRGRNYNGLGGFSSHASSMISSLKNNLKERSIERFKSSKVSAVYKKGQIDKKASPELLKKIRLKTKKQRQISLLKNILLFVVIASIFFLIVWLN